MTRILVNEEYGYRLWVWEHPGTIEEVINDWEARLAPLSFMDPSDPEQGFKGTVVPLENTDCGVSPLTPTGQYDAVAYVACGLELPGPGDARSEGDHLAVGKGPDIKRYYPAF